MPGTGGQKHNGCVRVDDESWSFDQGQLDFFTGRYPYYQDLDKLDLNYVNIEKAACTPVKFNVQKAPTAAEFSEEFEIEFIDEPQEEEPFDIEIESSEEEKEAETESEGFFQ